MMLAIGRLSSTVLSLTALAAAVSLPALADRDAPSYVQEQNSNWAGYVVTAKSTSFTSVTATWTLPHVACTAANRGAAVAFWVGLGGSTSSSKALEQTGTAGECGSGGVSAYHAWYQIVPGAPVTASLAVSAGDTVTASVNILENGLVALFQLKNRTTKQVFTTRVLLTSVPDLSSADWIAEAPTKCAQVLCFPVPLLKFGALSFSHIAALGNGIGGTLTHTAWTPNSLELVPSTVLVSGPSTEGARAGAVTGGLTPDGRSFEVVWSANGRAAANSL